MNNVVSKPFAFRKELVETLGNEIGKSIYKQFTQNEKYTQYELNYMELKQLVDTTYATIYEQVYKDRYGETIANEMIEEKKHFEEDNKKEIEKDNIEREKREEKRRAKKKDGK